MKSYCVHLLLLVTTADIMILKYALWIRRQIYDLPLNCYLNPAYIVAYYEPDSKIMEIFSSYTNVCAQQSCIQFIYLMFN